MWCILITTVENYIALLLALHSISKLIITIEKISLKQQKTAKYTEYLLQ